MSPISIDDLYVWIGSWPRLSFWTKATLPSDWTLDPPRPTDSRSYRGRVLRLQDIGGGVWSGDLQGLQMGFGDVQIFDRRWPWFLPDNFFIDDISLLGLPDPFVLPLLQPPDAERASLEQLLTQVLEGRIPELKAIQPIRSVELRLSRPRGFGHYLTMLPNFNDATSPVVAEEQARQQALDAVMARYGLPGQLLPASLVAQWDPDVQAVLDRYGETPWYNRWFPRIQGAFTFLADAATIPISLREELSGVQLTLSASGDFGAGNTVAVPGLRAEYSLDYGVIQEAVRYLNEIRNLERLATEQPDLTTLTDQALRFLSQGNRIQIGLENVRIALAIGGYEIFNLSTALRSEQADVQLRIGNWGDADTPLFKLEQLVGQLTLLPWRLPDGRTTYPNLSLRGFELQQDRDVLLESLAIEIPRGAFSSIGLAGVVPFDITALSLAFAPAASGGVDLSRPLFSAAGRINTPLLQQQLRQLTGSPALQLRLFRWLDGAAVALDNDQELALTLAVDPSGALRLLNAPALRLDLDGLVIPLPSSEQPILSGSLLLGGTDADGAPLSVPEALLRDVGVLELLPLDLEPPQALLSGRVSAADGRSGIAALLSGRLQEIAGGNQLLLEGQLAFNAGFGGDTVLFEGALEAALRWQLQARRNGEGQLNFSGFPSLQGVGLRELRFQLGDVLAVSVDELAWTAGPLNDPFTGSAGLVARARGLALEIQAGALAGLDVRSSGAEVRLFDLDADGTPDHFYLDGLELSLTPSQPLQLGPVRLQGNLRLRIDGLSNLPGLRGEAPLSGTLRFEADRADLQLGEAFSGSLQPPPTADGSAPPPAVKGRLNLSSGDVELELQRLEASLSQGGQPLLSLAASAGTAATPALRLSLRADAGPDDAVLRLGSLLGSLPALAIAGNAGAIAPALEITDFGLQRDGDIELGGLSLSLPPGYGRQLSLAGLLPFEPQRLGLRFAARADGSVDAGRVLLQLEGQLQLAELEAQLRQLLAAPELRLRLSRSDPADPSGAIVELAADAPLALQARFDAGSGALTVLDSPFWLLQLEGLPLPAPGEARALLAGTLLLPGTDALGQPLPLPAPLISQLLQQLGSSLDPAAVMATAPQVLALLRGALQAPGGGADLFVSGDGSLLLSGSLSSDAAGSRLSLVGEAQLSPALRFPGLLADASLNTRFAWDLSARNSGDGTLRFSGLPSLSGARIERLRLQLEQLLTVAVDRLSWSRAPQLDPATGSNGLIALGQGLTLELTGGPLAGLRLGSPDSEIRLFDLEGQDGVVDHVLLDAELSLADLQLPWLSAQRLALELRQISNLPQLDPNPRDGTALSGQALLEIRELTIGPGAAGLRVARAFGSYDLGLGSLTAGLEGLQLELGALRLQGAGLLSIDPDAAAGDWARITAKGTLQIAASGLPSLAADVSLNLDRDGGLSRLQGRLSTAPTGARLGELELLGALGLDYMAATNSLSLQGNVRLAGIDATASIRFRPGEEGFEASLTISNQSRLELADWLQLTPESLQALYTYDPSSGSRLTLQGDATLALNARELPVRADLLLDWPSGGSGPRLLQGGLQLRQAVEGLRIAGFGLDLIADDTGLLPRIGLVERNGSLQPQIQGRLRLPDLQGLTISLDPASGGLAYSSDGGWSFASFSLDLTPAGPLDLGIIRIGDDATLQHRDGVFSLDPDLAINAALLGQVLAPVAGAIDSTIVPLVSPVRALLGAEINLDGLAELEQRRPYWLLPGLWEPVVRAGRDLRSALLDTFEDADRNYANPYRGDNRVQVVEILDKTAFTLFRLLQANPSLAMGLAQQLGLPEAFVQAALNGRAYVSMASGLAILDSLAEIAAAVRQTTPAATATGSFVAIPDLIFRFGPEAATSHSGNVSGPASADSPIIEALLAVRDRIQAGPTAGSSQGNAEALIRAAAALSLPLLDQPLETVMALLSGQPTDLFRLDLDLAAQLAASYDQIVPVPLGPVVLPLSFGAEASVQGALQASLGLRTSSAALQALVGDVLAGDSAAARLAAIAQLLAPADASDSGLYLAQPAGGRLLQLSPRLQVRGGLDAGAVGLRAFIGLEGELALELLAERLYLGQLLSLLTAEAPTSLQQLGELLRADLRLNAVTGVETKLLSWETLFQLAYPILDSSQSRVSAGPVVNAEVFLDLRSYDAAGALIAAPNLRREPTEPATRSDSTGAFALPLPVDPRQIGNRDAVLDFRDGLVLAGTPLANGRGLRFSLVDALSGVDLGLPFVGLPGGNLTLLTTLKFIPLLGWRPGDTIAGQPLTPAAITEQFASRLVAVPIAFREDDFQLYAALNAADPLLRQQGYDSLIFSYQHLFAVQTIAELLRQLEGEEASAAAGEAAEAMADRDALAAPELRAVSAYGRAILRLFGPAEGPNLELDPAAAGPLAERFDLSRADHLRAVLAEILRSQPHPALQDDAALTLLSDGLAAISEATRALIERTAALDALIPVAGAQLLAASLAGPKRQLLQELIPALVRSALAGGTDQAAAAQLQAAWRQPTLVDAPGRRPDALIRASAVQTGPLPAGQGEAQIAVSLRDAEGRPVEAPDYGLSIRFRLGGTALAGRDYRLPEALAERIAFVPPGDSGMTIGLPLLPGFFEHPDRTLQLELLSADSGFAVAGEAAVVTFRPATPAPQALPAAAVAEGSRASFRPQRLAQGWWEQPATIVHGRSTAEVVLRGVRDQADRFVLRPSLGVLPHIENFRPAEGDQLLVDPQALQELRRDPALRRYSEESRRQALEQLEAELGGDAVSRLSAAQLAEALRPRLEALDPLPALAIEQLGTYGGLLFDLVSGQPLAQVSDADPIAGDRAYSSLSADPVLAAIAWLPDAAWSRALVAVQTLDSAGVVAPAAAQQLRQQGIQLSDTAVELALAADRSPSERLLHLELQPLTAALPLRDGLGQPLPDRILSAYRIDGQGGLTAWNHDSTRGPGARIYDLDQDGNADLLTLPLGMPQMPGDGTAGRETNTQVALAAVELRPLLFCTPGDALVQALDPDPARSDLAVTLVLQATLDRRPSGSQQIGYVVLEASELADAGALLADPERFRSRALPLFHTLPAADVTLPQDAVFSRELLLRHGQAVQFFELLNGSLEELRSGDDARLQILRCDAAAADARSLTLSAAGGSAIELRLSQRAPDLQSLIAREQEDQVPLLDFSAFGGSRSVRGSLQLAREALYDAVSGFHRVVDRSGRVRDGEGRLLSPGEADYASVALQSHNLVDALTGLAVPDRQVATLPFELQEQGLLAPFTQVNGTTFFAFAAANSDGLPHFRLLGTNRIGLEDQLGLADRDFDDHVMLFTFEPLPSV